VGGYDLEICNRKGKTLAKPLEREKIKSLNREGVFYEQTNVYRSGGIEAQAQACRISTYKFRR
jgi:hypothetical protein